MQAEDIEEERNHVPQCRHEAVEGFSVLLVYSDERSSPTRSGDSGLTFKFGANEVVPRAKRIALGRNYIVLLLNQIGQQPDHIALVRNQIEQLRNHIGRLQNHIGRRRNHIALLQNQIGTLWN